MRAVRLLPEGLTVEELEVPRPLRGEALVRVHAAAI
jgi:NADPH:quinone reductase-like Zn-dependent oxidoreductase